MKGYIAKTIAVMGACAALSGCGSRHYDRPAYSPEKAAEAQRKFDEAEKRLMQYHKEAAEQDRELKELTRDSERLYREFDSLTEEMAEDGSIDELEKKLDKEIKKLEED